MKLIIAGSRDIVLTLEELDELIKKHFEPSEIKEIVTGCAKGVDTTDIKWADKYNIPIKKFIPDCMVKLKKPCVVIKI